MEGYLLNCGNLFHGFSHPVFVKHLDDAIQEVVGAGLVSESVVHRKDPAAHLPEGPLQDIGGADGFPPLRGKIIK